MLNETEWFAGLAAIPEVNYQRSQRVDVSKHWASKVTPIREKASIYESSFHYWPMKEGTGRTTACPVQQEGLQTWEGPTEEILLRLETLLELPGYASSYHFVIQGCAEALWKRRIQEPQVLGLLEELFWLDIRLAQARPDAFRLGEPARFVAMHAFSRLLRIYEREGFTLEALEVARLCDEFGQMEKATDRLSMQHETELEEDRK